MFLSVCPKYFKKPLYISFQRTFCNSPKMSYKKLSSIPAEERKKFIESFDTVLADCDGVLWLGQKPLPGSPQVMNTFKKMGKRTFFVTNNSTLTRQEFVEKCNRLGFDAGEENIISTAWLAAHYLKNRDFNKKVYIVGPKAVEEELKAVGIESLGVGQDTMSPLKIQNSGVVLDEYGKTQSDVGAVIVGFDHYFSLPKIVKASTYLNDPECLFIGTNTDERYPHPGKFVWPGTGVFVSAIETCAQRKATILGKPSTYIIDEILAEFKIEPKRTLMIGDRCNTDILFGNRRDMITLMVLTGVSSEKDLENYIAKGELDHVPMYFADSLAEIESFLE